MRHARVDSSLSNTATALLPDTGGQLTTHFPVNWPAPLKKQERINRSIKTHNWVLYRNNHRRQIMPKKPQYWLNSIPWMRLINKMLIGG